jgi:A/G-specific adenine glycosylase
LPWRQNPRDPYHVLVSELMLQQTQVERVVPKFAAFLEAFPDLASLARSSEHDVLSQWSGLGYYRRARLLHRLARQVVADTGDLPRTARELQRLPGIGPYTAAAVASLVHDEPVPVLDGNVLRVASRVLAMDTDPRSAAGRDRILDWARPLVEHGPAGEVNEALMELGATVCTPSAPACGDCPLSDGCRGRAGGRPTAYPAPRAARQPVKLRWVAACCIDPTNRWLVRRVDRGPILRGLWLPPIAELGDGDDARQRALELVAGAPVASSEVLPDLRHSITHRRIRVTPVRLRVDSGSEGDLEERWIRPGEPSVPTSSLLNKLIEINTLEPPKKNE